MGRLKLAFIHHVDYLPGQFVDLRLLLNLHEFHTLYLEQFLFLLLQLHFVVALLIIEEAVEISWLGSITLRCRRVHHGRECAFFVWLICSFLCFLLELLISLLQVSHGPFQELFFTELFVGLHSNKFIFSEQTAESALFLVHFLDKTSIRLGEIFAVLCRSQSTN